MGVAVIWTQALEAETQGFQVILDFVIARLRNPVELTGTGPTRRLRARKFSSTRRLTSP
jgi:hypothetical protein